MVFEIFKRSKLIYHFYFTKFNVKYHTTQWCVLSSAFLIKSISDRDENQLDQSEQVVRFKCTSYKIDKILFFEQRKYDWALSKNGWSGNFLQLQSSAHDLWTQF